MLEKGAVDESWLYLAAVKDLATMEIVGWSMSERLESTLCEDALNPLIDCHAINCRAVNGDPQPTPRTGADHPHPPLRHAAHTLPGNGQTAERSGLPSTSAQKHRPDRPKADHALTF